MIYNTGSLSAICDPGSRNDTDSPGLARSAQNCFLLKIWKLAEDCPSLTPGWLAKTEAILNVVFPDISSIIQALPFEKIQDNSVL